MKEPSKNQQSPLQSPPSHREIRDILLNNRRLSDRIHQLTANIDRVLHGENAGRSEDAGDPTGWAEPSGDW